MKLFDLWIDEGSTDLLHAAVTLHLYYVHDPPLNLIPCWFYYGQKSLFSLTFFFSHRVSNRSEILNEGWTKADSDQSIRSMKHESCWGRFLIKAGVLTWILCRLKPFEKLDPLHAAQVYAHAFVSVPLLNLQRVIFKESFSSLWHVRVAIETHKPCYSSHRRAECDARSGGTSAAEVSPLHAPIPPFQRHLSIVREKCEQVVLSAPITWCLECRLRAAD